MACVSGVRLYVGRLPLLRTCLRSISNSSSAHGSATAATANAAVLTDKETSAPQPPTSSSSSSSSSSLDQLNQKTSKAMQIYIELSNKHEAFMKKQLAEYNIGVRHLANMMGEDPDFFTQQDVDRSIRYLFPSGLFDKRARPIMKHPDDVFPKQKEAKFDNFGRPFHSMFYTARPNYNEALHSIAVKVATLDDKHNKMLQRGENVDQSQAMVLLGSSWINCEQLSLKFMENIWPEQYGRFIQNLNRLVVHPLSHLERDFIFSFRLTQSSEVKTVTIPELTFDESGRPFVEAVGRRKRTNAHVVVRGRGSGDFSVNGHPAAAYFLQPHQRTGLLEMLQLMYPLQLTDMLDSVDVEARVWHDSVAVAPIATCTPLAGMAGAAASAEAGAIRLALSQALRSFVEPSMLETMRAAGLLTTDPRRSERKKTGKRGARRSRTYRKR